MLRSSCIDVIMGLSTSVTVSENLSLQLCVDLPWKYILCFSSANWEAFDTVSAPLASFSVGWSWTKPFKFWVPILVQLLQSQQTVECNDSVSVKPVQLVLVYSLPFVAS